MIHPSTSAIVLQQLLNLNWTAVSASTTGEKNNPTNPLKPTRLYLGMYATMPEADGSGGTEPSDADYKRVELTEIGIEGFKKLANDGTVQRKIGVYENTADASPSRTVTKTVAVVRNKNEIIYFPYTANGWGTVVGYGIFSQKTPGQGAPLFYGELKENVTVGADKVPLILKNKLELVLG